MGSLAVLDLSVAAPEKVVPAACPGQHRSSFRLRSSHGCGLIWVQETLVLMLLSGLQLSSVRHRLGRPISTRLVVPLQRARQLGTLTLAGGGVTNQTPASVAYRRAAPERREPGY